MLEKLRALFRVEKPAPITYYQPSGALAVMFDKVWSQMDPLREGGVTAMVHLDTDEADGIYPAGIYQVSCQMQLHRPGV